MKYTFTKVNIIFITIGALYLMHFLFFWFFPSTDSHFYYLFAHFLQTGLYQAPHPYYYNQPSTMEPPLYSVFVYLSLIFPRPDIVLHALSLSSIFISGILLFKVFSFYMKQKLAIIFSTLFLLFPAHLIYVSNMVAEPIAVLFITAYIYFLSLLLHKKKKSSILPLFLISAFGILQRYNMLGYFVLTAIIFLHDKKRVRAGWAGFIIGLGIIAGWIVINHQLNGAWSFSNAEGKHLYNRILHFDKLLPPVNDPAFIKFRTLSGLGTDADFFKPWWFYEQLLMLNLHSETESSKVMEEFALAALRTNPLKYVMNTPIFFIYAHNINTTYSDGLYRYFQNMQWNCRGNFEKIQFCQPILAVSWVPYVWDYLVEGIDWFFVHIWKYLNFLILFPSLIYALIQKDAFIKICSLLYIGSVLFFVLVEAPLPRYTYIFTPLWVILISYGLYKAIGRLPAGKKK